MARDPGGRELVVRAAATARAEGLSELVDRGVPVVRRRRARLCRRLLARAGGVPAGRAYLRARRRLGPDSITNANPFERLWVDPARIERQVRTPSKRWGRVDDGDWDRTAIPVADTDAYRSVEAHFERGVPWRKTAEFDRYRERLAAGEQPKGCSTEAELEERFSELDAIYERIASDGYRSQPELWADRPDYQRAVFYKWDRTLDPRLDEITASIGRDGSLVHADRGDHRLAIAKLLGLESIPVLIRRRHARWQAVRDEFAAANRRSALSDRAREHVAHPDLQDCHAFDPSAERESRSVASASTASD